MLDLSAFGLLFEDVENNKLESKNLEDKSPGLIINYLKLNKPFSSKNY